VRETIYCVGPTAGQVKNHESAIFPVSVTLRNKYVRGFSFLQLAFVNVKREDQVYPFFPG
jgi:hypothetical protein